MLGRCLGCPTVRNQLWASLEMCTQEIAKLTSVHRREGVQSTTRLVPQTFNLSTFNYSSGIDKEQQQILLEGFDTKPYHHTQGLLAALLKRTAGLRYMIVVMVGNGLKWSEY